MLLLEERGTFSGILSKKKMERNRNRLLFRFAGNGEEIQRFCFITLYSCLSYTLILKKKKTGFLISQQQYWKLDDREAMPLN